MDRCLAIAKKFLLNQLAGVQNDNRNDISCVT